MIVTQLIGHNKATVHQAAHWPRVMKGLVLMLGLWSLAQQAMAQLQEGDTARYRLNLSGHLRYNSGNFERLLTGGELALKSQDNGGNWVALTSTRYTYGTFGKSVTEDDWFSRHYVYHRPRAAVYPFAMHWWQRSRLMLLDSRHQLGAGLTVALLRRQGHVLKLSAMGSWEQNQFARPGLTLLGDDLSSGFNTWRGTVRIQGNHRWQYLRLGYEAYLQPALDDWSNNRAYIDANVQVPLHKALALRLAYTWEYNTVHVRQLKPQDALLTLGLNLDLQAQ